MSTMQQRRERQDEIKRIVRGSRIRTQRELVDLLKTKGYDCTQATVSRDVTDMGLRKQGDGIYVLAEDLHLQRMIDELVMSVVNTSNMAIVKTSPGTAQGVAAALDAADLTGILGSIAGDDTVLVITQDEKSAMAFTEHVIRFMSA